MVLINKKIYKDNGFFVEKHHEEYFNLEIYPMINELEREAGLLSDFAEAFKSKCNFIHFGDDTLEPVQFINNNVNFDNDELFKIKISRVDNSFTSYKNVLGEVVLCMENKILDKNYIKKIKIQNLEKVLYIKSQETVDVFKNNFWYYFDQGNFVYDNLVCYCMIIKNGGPILEEILTANLPFIDRWCILDTGSTDGTQEIIKRVLKNKKGTLYNEPFVNFKISRNRCLELAGHTCKFNIMLDDTYSVKGDLRSFLTEIRGDQFSDSFSMLIQSDDTEYYSNRIVKSTLNLKYIYTIHEVINDKNNINVTIPCNRVVIFDRRVDYMEKRTNERKQFDLQLLFKEIEDEPNDPRAYYYVAQTYGCINDEFNKAIYFEKRIAHPVQGYIQEKIDACFELARTYNFKIDQQGNVHNGIISNDLWKRCEELYLQAFNLDKNRPDSLYFIGIHYYLEKNLSLAYKFFKQGFEIGYPINSQYSLKPTLSFHFLPKFLTEICYFMEDYVLGLKASELFLSSSKYNTPTSDGWNLISNWNRIHTNLIKFSQFDKKQIYHKQEIFCIVADGGWENWTGSDINTKGMGGSETWVIEMARYIQRNTNKFVIVFCKTERPEFFEGVGYNPINLFHEFVAQNVVSYCIISRFPEYVPVAIKGNCINIGLIFHDIILPETVIPIDPKLKWIFGLTDWHSNTIKKMFPQQNVLTLNYGINENENEIVKVKNSFIYSSFPNRGLVVLLKMWPRIQELFPGSVLNIYCNLEQEWVNRVSTEEMIEIKERIKTLNCVIVHGWVNKQTLKSASLSADYWFYPCKFEETFCLTAMEAAISKTFVISNNLAALGETINSRGLIVHGDVLTQEWQDTVIEKLSLLSDSTKQELITLNYNWAKEKTWERQANKLVDIVCLKHGWYKIKEINDYLINKTNESLEVLDIGCGNSPFENATCTIDILEKSTFKLNVETETIPKDIVDFVYTRHLLEDLNKPQLILKEISRIAKAGYIETPSVIAECTRYVDCGVNGNFGYRHHHSILWTTDTHTLKIIPKIEEYISEYFTFDKMIYFKELLKDPFLWNNYYFFDINSPLKYEFLTDLSKEIYFKLLDEAFDHTIKFNSIVKKLVLENIDYSFMMNWTNDVPKNTKNDFIKILKKLPINSKLLEVGTYTGTGIIEMLNTVPNSTGTVIDLWESYHEHDNVLNNDTITEDISKLNIEQIFYNNTKELNIKVLKGRSSNKLLELLMENEKFNFIYIDASHRCLDVFVDATIAWKLLKINGIIGFDDYLFNKGDILNSPHDAINYFMEQQKDNFIVLNEGYRIFLQKIN